MAYISTRIWRDLTDHHLYHEGDPFPFDGRDVPADRLQQLETGRNRAGLQMIQAAAETQETGTEETPEAEIKAEPEAKPKARKPRKPKE